MMLLTPRVLNGMLEIVKNSEHISTVKMMWYPGVSYDVGNIFFALNQHYQHFLLLQTMSESRIAFEIDPNIDINGLAGHDIRDCKGPSHWQPVAATSNQTNLEKKISASEGFDNW